MKKKIFEPVKLGHLEVKNRLVRSATLEAGGAKNGRISPQLTTFYDDLARGGVGLIITGMMGVAPNACLSSGMVKSYGDAALVCKNAGADGVQIHGAHGYLLSQFLSPLFNQRLDEYGGGIKNRARILLAVYDEIRAKVGDDFPVMIKINYSDIADGGITEADVLWYCMELDKRGIDAIEVSSGIGVDKASGSVQGGRTDEAFNADYAKALAAHVKTAIISVGGYRLPETITRILNEKAIDAVSLCRPLIREPDLPARWEAGSTERSSCTSCSSCFRSKVLGCYLDQRRTEYGK